MRGDGPVHRTPCARGWTLFASPLIRNRATIGGNLVTASPIGDAAPLLLALDATVELAGRRWSAAATGDVPIDEFFTGYRKTRCSRARLICRAIPSRYRDD